MIETAADRLSLIEDAPNLALFAEIPDAVDDEGQAAVIVQRNVSGLFDRAFRLVGAHEGYHPVFLCVDEDVLHLRQHHRIMVKGQVWRVETRMPDGTGFTQLALKLLGPYRLDPNGLSSRAGFPYALPIVLGATSDEHSSITIDPNNPRLRYPYTVETYLDYSSHTVAL